MEYNIYNCVKILSLVLFQNACIWFCKVYVPIISMLLHFIREHLTF